MDPLTGWAIAGPLAGLVLGLLAVGLGWGARGRAEAGWAHAHDVALSRLEAELRDAQERAQAFAGASGAVVSLERALSAARDLRGAALARRLLQLGDGAAGAVAPASGEAGSPPA